MNDRANLERAYRRLLRAYPRDFQREKGEELLAVLMSSARDGQRRPGISDTADLVKSALWMRVRPPLPHGAPAVRMAVLLMYVGAAFTALELITSLIALFVVGRGAAKLRVDGHTQPLSVAVTAGILEGVVIIFLWLLAARKVGRGSNRARIMSTVILAGATLQFLDSRSVAQSTFAGLTWLIALAAVWFLWRPSSARFFSNQNASSLGESTRPH